MPTLPNAADPPRQLAAWLFALLAVAAVVGGTWLRTAHLDRAPLHADEAATGARVLADRLEDGRYRFDPRHHHGPLLTAATVPVAVLRGETGWNDLTKTTLRMVPAAAGVLTLLLILLTTPALRSGAALGALFAATSPLLVVYHRLYLHEPLQGLGLLLLIVAALRYAARPAWPWAVAAGAAAGMMLSNKETAVITGAAWAAAGATLALLSARGGLDLRAGAQRHGPGLGLAAATTAAVAAIFYTDLGRHPAGAVDFLRTYFVYETSPGHHKPAGYYAHLLLWPKFRGGFWWFETLVLIPAVVGFVASFRDPRGRAIRFLGLAALAEALVYTLIAYKTPWLMLVVWLQVCLVAGYGAARLLTVRPVWGRSVAAAALVAIVAWQAQQAVRAAHRFPADDRNPYAYVPTATGIEKLAPWIDQLVAASPAARAEPLAVVGDGHWPLPWYLRRFERVGYWSDHPEGVAELPVVLVVPHATNTPDQPDPLAATHTALPRSLRTDTPVVVYVRHDVWADYQNADTPQ